MPLLAHEQRSPEWFAARTGKITASLAGACLGLDPYCGPLSAFNQITGRTVREDNRHMAWGREFEATAREAYEVLSGNFVVETGLWVHDDYPWLAASPDGLVSVCGLVEIKCPSNLPLEIPPHHEIQMRVQLACTGREWCDYYAWNQTDVFCRRLVRDALAQEDLLLRLGRWYDQHVKPDMAPPRRRTA